MQIGTNQLYHLGPFACSRERTKPDMEDVPYRMLLESLTWTQARAGVFLGVSRQTSNAFATGHRQPRLSSYGSCSIGAVKARPPGCATVDFTSVEMGERANLRGTELELLGRRRRGFLRIA